MVTTTGTPPEKIFGFKDGDREIAAHHVGHLEGEKGKKGASGAAPDDSYAGPVGESEIICDTLFSAPEEVTKVVDRTV
jgi:hypothetical protein